MEISAERVELAELVRETMGLMSMESAGGRATVALPSSVVRLAFAKPNAREIATVLKA
jgi:hypothetical protein